MSMIGSFGLCKKSSYDTLLTSIADNDFETAKNIIEMICCEMEDNSVPKTEVATCSGDVFIPLFHYFKTNLGIDVRNQENFNKLVEIWRETTDDFDMVAFTEIEKAQFLTLSETINFNEIIQFVNDFFQDDFGEAGKIACNNFFENLKIQKPGYVLIWRLY